MVKEGNHQVESKMVFIPQLIIWNLDIKHGRLGSGVLPYNRFSWKHLNGTKINGTMFDERRKTAPQLILFKLGI